MEEAPGENQLSASSSQARVEAGAKVDALLRPVVLDSRRRRRRLKLRELMSGRPGGYVGSVESGRSGRSGRSGSRSSAATPVQGVPFPADGGATIAFLCPGEVGLFVE